MRARVLATLRHPGPVHCVAAAIAALPEASWQVASYPAARQMLCDTYPHLLPRITICDIPDDAGSDSCRRLFDAVRPDLVVRTTPSTGWGADELIAEVSVGRAPVVAVQDFPGLGLNLTGLVAAGAPDNTSAAWLQSRSGSPSTAIGWLAHNRFHQASPYDHRRSVQRNAAAVADSQTVILIVGSGPEVPIHQEEELIKEVAALADALAPTPVATGYRWHPRRPGDSSLTNIVAKHLGVRSLSAPDPVAADIVISKASVMNLELIADATTWNSRHLPLSVYFLQDDDPGIAGYWGPQRPTTHMPGGGSLCVRSGMAEAVFREMERGRPETSMVHARAYVSDPEWTHTVLSRWIDDR